LQSTIHDLFEVDQEEADAAKRMAAVLDRPKGEESSETEPSSTAERRSPIDIGSTSAAGSNNKAALGVLESALAAAEDETDVAAARIVRAEVAAEMAEFDESAPVAAEDADGNLVDAEVNKAEMELQQIEDQVEFFFKSMSNACQ
jgi:E1A-binding protein p400